MKNQTLFLLLFLTISIHTFGGEPKTTKPKQTTTEDISPDAVKYADNNKEEEVLVDGKDIILSGNNNRLTFKGTISKILITGKDNDITIESVNQITISGNGNFVSWEKSSNGKPVIQDKGGYNNIERRSSDAQDRSDN